MSHTLEPYELAITIDKDDIDQLGHVNNVVYLRWVQQAATAHWSAAATREEQQQLLWMITRHEIDYKRQAFLGDKISARTWIGEARRRNFERHTEIFRHDDNRVLAKAVTLWCPIDRDTKKPTIASDAIRQRFTT